MIPAYKTNGGATKQSYCMLNGKSMQFVGFQIGNGGCRDGQVLTVNRNVDTLPNLITTFDEDSIKTEIINGKSIRITCTVSSGTIAANYVSNIGILARVTGETSSFLYAVSNFSEIPVSGELSFAITLNN